LLCALIIKKSFLKRKKGKKESTEGAAIVQAKRKRNKRWPCVWSCVYAVVFWLLGFIMEMEKIIGLALFRC